MAKTTDRQIVNGQEYLLMDSKARGDIDELTGKSISQKEDLLSNCDFNDLETGWYQFSNSNNDIQNIPAEIGTNGHGVIVCFEYSSNYKVQLLISRISEGNLIDSWKFYQRACSSGTWSNWRFLSDNKDREALINNIAKSNNMMSGVIPFQPEMIDGSYINLTGDIIETEGCHYSDYIIVKGLSNIVYAFDLNGSGLGVSFYNENMALLSEGKVPGQGTVATRVNGTVNVPENATYVRFSSYGTNYNFIINGNTNNKVIEQRGGLLSNGDLNDLETGWYQFTNAGHTILNVPSEIGNGYGVIVCYEYSSEYKVQTMVAFDPGTERARMLYRMKTSDVWRNWQETSDSSDNYNIGCFDSIVLIGDSLSVGWFLNDDSTHTPANYKNSVGQYFVKKYGTKVYWGGESGATTKSIMTNTDTERGIYVSKGIDYIENLGAQALYIVSLGTNDSSQLDVGEITDIGTDADTFYRYYGDLIETIHTIAPDAPILCVSTFNYTVPNDYNYIVAQDICSRRSYCTFIDIRKELASKVANMRYGGHYNMMGYYNIAQIIDSVGGKAMCRNIYLADCTKANLNMVHSDVDPYELA